MPDSQPPVYYPVLMDLRGQAVVVVGGGEIARRKVEGLQAAQARVTVVAPVCEGMPEPVILREKAYDASDLEGQVLVFAATDDVAVNAEIARDAKRRGIWVNAVDDAKHCTFILPAVVRRGALVLAISTAGASPALARRIKEGLEAVYGKEYAELLQLLWTLRQEWNERIRQSGKGFEERRIIWESILDLPLLALIGAGEEQAALERSRSLLGAAFP